MNPMRLFANLFGSGNPRSARRPSFRPELEALEDRALPALIGVGSSLLASRLAPVSGLTARSAAQLSLGPTRGGAVTTPSPRVSGSYGTDASLASPTITRTTIVADNAIRIEWNDTNTTHNGYLVIARERGAHSGTIDFRPDRNVRATTLQAAFRPGATYDLTMYAVSSRGLSRNPAMTMATVSASPIRIGDPSNGQVWNPSATGSFAVWDADGNGLVNYATRNGPFPLGNGYDSVNGTRANIIVGYTFREGNATRFVAFHLFINPFGRVTPVSVLYGDYSLWGTGQSYWVGGIQQSNLQFTPATNTSLNLIAGRVTAPLLASDGSMRIVEFDFNLALMDDNLPGSVDVLPPGAV